MFPGTPILITLLSLLAGPSMALTGPEVVYNISPQDKTHHTISLEELWRVGDDEEIFFGQISTIASDQSDQLFVLDGKQNHIQVFGKNGNHLRTLLREGDGPGEIRNATDMFLTQENMVVVSAGFPGGLVFLLQDGIPAGKKRITPMGAGKNKICFLDNAASLSGAPNGEMIFVWGGQQTIDGTREQLRCLSLFSNDLQEITRYHETRHLRGRSIAVNEASDYFPEDNLHCIGPDGRLYFAPERNDYRIKVFSSDGQELNTIERKFKSRKRNANELEYIQGLYSPSAGGSHGKNIPAQVSEFAPDIEALHIGPEGNLWVQHSLSSIDQPDGIMLTYDVFNPDGIWLSKKFIACAGNGFRDRLVPLTDGRWLRLVGAIIGYTPPVGDGDEEDENLEVVCYTESQ